eukprot:ANDGO_04777.mRNA.1 hypothetical protein
MTTGQKNFDRFKEKEDDSIDDDFPDFDDEGVDSVKVLEEEDSQLAAATLDDALTSSRLLRNAEAALVMSQPKATHLQSSRMAASRQGAETGSHAHGNSVLKEPAIISDALAVSTRILERFVKNASKELMSAFQQLEGRMDDLREWQAFDESVESALQNHASVVDSVPQSSSIAESSSSNREGTKARASSEFLHRDGLLDQELDALDSQVSSLSDALRSDSLTTADLDSILLLFAMRTSTTTPKIIDVRRSFSVCECVSTWLLCAWFVLSLLAVYVSMMGPQQLARIVL